MRGQSAAHVKKNTQKCNVHLEFAIFYRYLIRVMKINIANWISMNIAMNENKVFYFYIFNF